MFRPGRVTSFSDGVLSISITLLVLNLEVPSVHEVPDKQLGSYLVATIRPMVGYISSFVLIGMYWLQHYVVFQFITRVDRTMIVLNGLFLLCVSFVPFPTGLQATYRNDVMAMFLYTGAQASCGLALMAVWYYATKDHRLVPETVSPAIVKSMKWRIAMTPVISMGAAVLAFVNVDLSRVILLAIPAVYLSHRVVDRSWNPPADSA